MRLFSRREPIIDPSRYQPPLPLPAGYTRAQILDALLSVSIDGSAIGELRGYATADCERFIHTLALVPPEAEGRLLEIGANPYFTTLLLRRFRPALERSLVNFFGDAAGDACQTVTFRNFDGEDDEAPFSYINLNIEAAPLPYPDAHFDIVLFCEVLEHMTGDPLRALLELKRVLKPGGTMVLTTPNAARLENVVAFLEGRNMYDPYSGYGPYGRHNREYTRHELHLLMNHAGFKVETSYTANVYANVGATAAPPGDINRLLSHVPGREHDLGQYLVTRWRNDDEANRGLPRWLYRSYPEDAFA